MSTINTNTTSTTASAKLTQREYYAIIKDIVLGNDVQREFNIDDVVAFIDSRVAQLDKKALSAANGEKKPTARQIENDGLKTAILANMEQGVLYTIGDMIKQFDCFAEDMSSQRLNAIISQMYADAKRSDGLTKMGTQPTVERVEEKRKAYFRKIG